jgi:hypothetical protein
MNKLKDFPKALLMKVFLTALIGFGCMVVGAAYFIFSRDNITLALSGAVFIFSIARSVNLYYTIAKQKYETVEGTCIGVSSKLFGKHFTVKVMDDAGIESSLRFGKQTKVKIGFRYRFYFKPGQRLSIGNAYFDTALSSDHFLGFEELGEYMAPQTPEPDSAAEEKKLDTE